MVNWGNEFQGKIFKERYQFVNSTEEGIQKSLDEDFAFIWADDVMANLVGQKCTHVAIPQSMMNFVVGIAMKKKSPYRNMFNYFLSKLKETGQLSRIWSLRRVAPRTDCFDMGTSGLGIYNMILAFLALLGAVALSLAVVACELWYGRKSRE